MDERLTLLKEISELPGVPGYEDEVSDYIAAKMRPYAEVTKDNLGSVICKKAGTSDRPRIMLAGHMDEVGGMVMYVTKEGAVKFQVLGGLLEQVSQAQRFVIKTSSGDVIGVTGTRPPHIQKPDERAKVPDRSRMFIDVGASSKEEAEAMGIVPGDPVIPFSPFTVMKNPKYLLGKAFDDRAGCAVFMEVIRALQGVEHPNTVYGVGTVQEEVGTRGATTSGAAVDPDICIVLEFDIPGDTPNVAEWEGRVRLGKGPGILVYDNSLIAHRRLRDFVIATAKSAGIPLQFGFMPGGGNDGGKIQVNRTGVPTLPITIPVRYGHCHTGIMHRDDFDMAVTLVTEMMKRLDEPTVKAIKGNQ